jgi:hypothetical protein
MEGDSLPVTTKQESENRRSETLFCFTRMDPMRMIHSLQVKIGFPWGSTAILVWSVHNRWHFVMEIHSTIVRTKEKEPTVAVWLRCSWNKKSVTGVLASRKGARCDTAILGLQAHGQTRTIRGNLNRNW